MPANQVIETIKSRRSIRQYQDKPVPADAIDTLLECAAYAPSAMDRQPCRYTVITDPAARKRLSDAVKTQGKKMKGLDPRFIARFNDPEDMVFYDAPLIIAISAPEGDDWSAIDAALAAENLFIGAKSLGLGSCYIGFANMLNADKAALDSMGVPAGHKLFAVLVFGYPKEAFPPAPERKAIVVKRI